MTKLDRRKRIPVNRIKQLAFQACNWAITREKLRETQLLVKKNLNPEQEVSNPFEEDFNDYIEGCIIEVLRGMEANEKAIREIINSRKL